MSAISETNELKADKRRRDEVRLRCRQIGLCDLSEAPLPARKSPLKPYSELISSNKSVRPVSPVVTPTCSPSVFEADASKAKLVIDVGWLEFQLDMLHHFEEIDLSKACIEISLPGLVEHASAIPIKDHVMVGMPRLQAVTTKHEFKLCLGLRTRSTSQQSPIPMPAHAEPTRLTRVRVSGSRHSIDIRPGSPEQSSLRHALTSNVPSDATITFTVLAVRRLHHWTIDDSADQATSVELGTAFISLHDLRRSGRDMRLKVLPLCMRSRIQVGTIGVSVVASAAMRALGLPWPRRGASPSRHLASPTTSKAHTGRPASSSARDGRLGGFHNTAATSSSAAQIAFTPPSIVAPNTPLAASALSPPPSARGHMSRLAAPASTTAQYNDAITNLLSKNEGVGVRLGLNAQPCS